MRSTRPSPSPEAAAVERCDLCSVLLAPAHRHLLEMSSRSIVCACNPCALRFHDVVDGRFRLIPRDGRRLADFAITDLQWEALALPINLVFVYYDSIAVRRMAQYPSPAGVTESLLPAHAWDELVEDNPALADMEDDVEALLINRLGEAPLYLIAPIDACYELAGLIRVHWRGLSGGEEVWAHVDRFFSTLHQRAHHA